MLIIHLLSQRQTKANNDRLLRHKAWWRNKHTIILYTIRLRGIKPKKSTNKDKNLLVFFFCYFSSFISPSSYLPAYEDGRDRVFRNVDIRNSDARNYPEESSQNLVNWQLCPLIFRHNHFFLNLLPFPFTIFPESLMQVDQTSIQVLTYFLTF